MKTIATCAVLLALAATTTSMAGDTARLALRKQLMDEHVETAIRLFGYCRQVTEAEPGTCMKGAFKMANDGIAQIGACVDDDDPADCHVLELLKMGAQFKFAAYWEQPVAVPRKPAPVSDRPRFTGPVACPNPTDKTCCPAGYVWEVQNRMCRLATSIRPDPVP